MHEKLGIDQELVDNVKGVFATRGEADKGPLFGAERVDITLEGPGNGPFRVRKREFEFIVDEPPLRGGTDQGPNPLAFLLAGSATCFLSHFMLVSIRDELKIDGLKLTARGHFDRRLIGGSFEDMIYDVKVRSRESAEDIAATAQFAEKSCYAHNTLVQAGVDLTINLELNGEHLLTLVAATDHLPGSD